MCLFENKNSDVLASKLNGTVALSEDGVVCVCVFLRVCVCVCVPVRQPSWGKGNREDTEVHLKHCTFNDVKTEESKEKCKKSMKKKSAINKYKTHMTEMDEQ